MQLHKVVAAHGLVDGRAVELPIVRRLLQAGGVIPGVVSWTDRHSGTVVSAELSFVSPTLLNEARIFPVMLGSATPDPHRTHLAWFHIDSIWIALPPRAPQS